LSPDCTEMFELPLEIQHCQIIWNPPATRCPGSTAQEEEKGLVEETCSHRPFRRNEDKQTQREIFKFSSLAKLWTCPCRVPGRSRKHLSGEAEAETRELSKLLNRAWCCGSFPVAIWDCGSRASATRRRQGASLRSPPHSLRDVM